MPKPRSKKQGQTDQRRNGQEIHNGLVSIIQSLGIPDDLETALGDATGSVLDQLLATNPRVVADYARKNNDIGLLARAGWAILDTSVLPPKEVLDISMACNDLQLAQQVGYTAIELPFLPGVHQWSPQWSPELAYRAGIFSGDANLIKIARQKFVDDDPEAAYLVGLEHNDHRLVRRARMPFARDDPKAAYNAAQEHHDVQLARIARPLFAKLYPEEAYREGDGQDDLRLQWLAVRYLLKNNPFFAYDVVRSLSTNERLLQRARRAFVAVNAHEAYRKAAETNDSPLKSMAVLALRDCPPDAVYGLGMEFSDKDILLDARQRYAKTEPVQAYQDSVKQRDFHLREAALDRLVEVEKLSPSDAVIARQLYRSPLVSSALHALQARVGPSRKTA